MVSLDGREDTAGRLREQRSHSWCRFPERRDSGVHARAAVTAHLRDRHRDAAVGDIVRELHDVVPNGCCNETGSSDAGGEVELGQRPVPAVLAFPRPPAAAQRDRVLRIRLSAAVGVRGEAGRSQHHELGLGRQIGGDRTPDEVRVQTDHAHHRRRADVGAVGLVVQADVAADDRYGERITGFGHAVDRLRQLPHDFGMGRIAEVQAVDERERIGAHTGKVQRRFDHHHGGSPAGISVAPAVVAVDRDSQAPTGGRAVARIAQSQQRGVVPGTDNRVQKQLVVVLPVYPARIREHPQQVGSAIARSASRRALCDTMGCRIDAAADCQISRRTLGTVIGRRVVVQRARPNLCQDWAFGTVTHPQHPVAGHSSDNCRTHLPPRADLEHPIDVGRRDDRQHPFLGLRGHDLERFHAVLTQGHRGDVDLHAGAATRGCLTGCAGQAGTPEILDPADESCFQQFEACFDEALFFERIADLNARAFVRIIVSLIEAC